MTSEPAPARPDPVDTRRSPHPAWLFACAAAYALLGWLPVGYLARGGGNARNFGLLTVPWWNVPLALGVTALAWAAYALLLPRVEASPRARTRLGVAIAAVGLVACWLAAYAVYLRYVDHYAPVSDRATALQYGWEELAAGRNPYYRHTQLDNTISPMVGGLILAGPFVLTHGDMYWQGLTWLAVVLAALWWLRGPWFALAAGALLVLSPALRLELAIQSDGWVNAAALALFGTALVVLADRVGPASRAGGVDSPHRGAWTAAYVAVSLLFALAFSYRFIYGVVALPLGVLLWRRAGLRTMLLAAVPAGVASAALIFVPYALDPSVYAPFTKAGLGTTESTVPHLPLITGIACVAVAIAGTALLRSAAGLWGTMAAVSVVLVVLTGWGQHDWYQYLTWAYNGGALVFGAFALASGRLVAGARTAIAEPTRGDQTGHGRR